MKAVKGSLQLNWPKVILLLEYMQTNINLIISADVSQLESRDSTNSRSRQHAPARSISTSPTRNITSGYFYKRNILSVEQFTDRAIVNQLMDVANRFQNDVEAGRTTFNILQVTSFLSLDNFE